MVRHKISVRLIGSVTAFLKQTWGVLRPLIANSVTLPYYRFYRQNTLLPILAIAKAVNNQESHDSQDSQELISEHLRHWQDRKLGEFKFIAGAGTLLAAAVIGCFSWPAPATIFWLGPACWYSSLVLSLFSVLLSSSEAFIFNSIKESPRRMDWKKQLAMVLHEKCRDATNHGLNHGLFNIPRPENSRHTSEVSHELPAIAQVEIEELRTKVDVRWNMVFTWQAPMMLMSYSVLFFLLGLSIFVLTPLYDGRQFDGEGKAAIFYIVLVAVGGATFVWCSFWSYRFVDLDGE